MRTRYNAFSAVVVFFPAILSFYRFRILTLLRIQNRIIQMLEKVSGGVFHFDISDILRNSLLISSILSNSEVWYGVTQSDTDQQEQVDEMWLRNLFLCSRKVPKDLLCLEMGLVPISYINKERRLMFLHHVLQQKTDSLVFKFFIAQ